MIKVDDGKKEKRKEKSKKRNKRITFLVATSSLPAVDRPTTPPARRPLERRTLVPKTRMSSEMSKQIMIRSQLNQIEALN